MTARSFLGQTLFRPCGEQDGRQAPRGREQCTPRRPSKCSTALGRSGRGAEWGQDWYPKDGPPHGTWNPRKEKSSFCTVSSGTFYFPHFVSETLKVQEGEVTCPVVQVCALAGEVSRPQTRAKGRRGQGQTGPGQMGVRKDRGWGRGSLPAGVRGILASVRSQCSAAGIFRVFTKGEICHRR